MLEWLREEKRERMVGGGEGTVQEGRGMKCDLAPYFGFG